MHRRSRILSRHNIGNIQIKGKDIGRGNVGSHAGDDEKFTALCGLDSTRSKVPLGFHRSRSTRIGCCIEICAGRSIDLYTIGGHPDRLAASLTTTRACYVFRLTRRFGGRVIDPLFGELFKRIGLAGAIGGHPVVTDV